MLKDFKPRIYQEKIFHTTVKKNTLVVLPTGLGKTAIALMLAAKRLDSYPKSKILILAPTRPLAEQHLKSFRHHIDIDSEKMVLFTGKIRPEKRMEMWDDAKIIISTPQGLENDIISNQNLLEQVSLLVVDEAHRAVKDYSYVFIAKQYHKYSRHERILGLTASPGDDTATIEEICSNLFVEDVELRSDDDIDVKQYVQDVDIEWLEVSFPEEFKAIKSKLEASFRSKLEMVKKFGLIQGSINSYTRKSLIELQAELRSRISSGEKDFETLKSISLIAEAMKVQHAIELLETQGLESLYKYFQKLQEQARTSTVKAVKNLMQDHDFLFARTKTDLLLEKKMEHPKMRLMKDRVKQEVSYNKNSKIMVFTQYRSTASSINKLLESIGITSKIFIGQNTKAEKGLSQKEQKKIIEEFSENQFSCLISTSVGEEGLDIPQVDLVIFYEPIPSAIRSIQRRGRTGRLSKGKVFVLMTKGTRDEVYRWAAHHKEKRMHRNLAKLKKNFKSKDFSSNQTLDSFKKKENNLSEISIVIDYREKGSALMRSLIDDGYDIKLKSLEIGDILLSDKIIIEFKTVKDFVDSIIDGRLLQQARELTKYIKPMIVVEGQEDLYGQRNIHANAIRGMLIALTLSYRIPVIFTRDHIETKEFVKLIIKRETEAGKEFQMHTAKPLSLKEQQEYVVAALPSIGGTLAKPLLAKFGSVKKVLDAPEEELKKVGLIGEKKAKKIRDIIDSDYISD